MFELKPLSKKGVPAAIEKAQHYRVLNEPLEAECICLDVLEIDPTNQEVLVILILALSDQFARKAGEKYEQARKLLASLDGEYERSYYEGILFERRAKSALATNSLGSGCVAYEWFLQAMGSYEKAIELRQKTNDEAILRWNTCARIVNRNPSVCPEPLQRAEEMLE